MKLIPWTRSIALAFAALSISSAFAQTAPPANPPTQPATNPATPAAVQDAMTAEKKAEVIKGIAEILENRAFVIGVDLKSFNNLVEKYKDDIEKAENIRTFSAAVNRAFREFGFSHLRLRTPQAAQSRQQGPVATGFGMNVEKTETGLVVRQVTPDSPAHKAGIEVGDVVKQLDGKAAESPEALSGASGTSAKITVQKKDGSTKDVELQRQQFSTARKETLRWIDDETAVLRVFTFSRGYGRQNIEELVKEANTKAKYLVLDLRSNGGGATDNLRHLLSLLLPENSVVGTFVNRRDAQKYAETTKSEATDPIKIAEKTERKYRTQKLAVPAFAGKIAVLTNRGSASASEICAAALREVAGAPIVGSRTAGAVLASVYGRLPHGFELQYPVTDYVTAKGIRLEGNPIMPDIEAPAPSQDKDEALDKAIEKLKAAKP